MSEDDRLNYEVTVSSLKQRVTLLEKELASTSRRNVKLERQLAATTKENQDLHAANALLSTKVEELERATMQQRHAYDKLSERYATAYANMERLSSTTKPTTDSLNVVVQTLSRENVELQRKVRVLEARHSEDKRIVANQEQRLKRLRAEMEALQHMNDAHQKQQRDDAVSSNESSSLSSSSTAANNKSSRDVNASSSSSSSSASTTSTSSPASTLARPPSVSQGAMPADDCQYIDPNILKILEKVDSQFSITNAISLAVALKKWLHSCLHVVASVDSAAVLRAYLQRCCELLHCQHAALFRVDHVGQRLLAVASERGDVRWELPLDKGLAGHAARHNAILNVRKAYDDPRFFSASDSITGSKSKEVLCVPVTLELAASQPTSVFAVLQAWNTTTAKPFSANDQIVAGLVASHAGAALLQTRATDALQRVNRQVPRDRATPDAAREQGARARQRNIRRIVDVNLLVSGLTCASRAGGAKETGRAARHQQAPHLCV
ncbi:hypothetical protein PINS_up020474 [Pythium insidiosum]|nr:hypothetical protein PINS_up020474 [Pythium insidiosum]